MKFDTSHLGFTKQGFGPLPQVVQNLTSRREKVLHTLPQLISTIVQEEKKA